MSFHYISHNFNDLVRREHIIITSTFTGSLSPDFLGILYKVRTNVSISFLLIFVPTQNKDKLSLLTCLSGFGPVVIYHWCSYLY